MVGLRIAFGGGAGGLSGRGFARLLLGVCNWVREGDCGMIESDGSGIVTARNQTIGT